MPCVYKLYGPMSYTDKLLNIVKSLKKSRTALILKILLGFVQARAQLLCQAPSKLSSRGAYAHVLGVLQLECPPFGGSKPL